MSNTFTCSNCGGTFHKKWSEEEQEAEYQKNFGADPLLSEQGRSQKEVVCEDCFKKFRIWFKKTYGRALSDDSAD